MIREKFRIFSLIVCLLFTMSLLSGCNRKAVLSGARTKLYSDMKFQNENVSEGTVFENERFSLVWNNKFKQVIINDRSNGAVYSTMPADAMVTRYDDEGFKIKNNPQIESPIIVYYNDTGTMTEPFTLASSDAIENGEVYTERTENGIRVIYDFSEQKISVPVEYGIYKNHFEISVDPTDISDDGEKYVTAVAVAPFLCSLKNDTEGSYLFIPDGSGALIEPNTIDLTGSQGSARVYGDDLAISKYIVSSYTEQMNMPVFGMKNGDNGLFAVITSAAEQAYINWNVGSSNIKYSSVYPLFRIRGYDYVKKPANFLANFPQIQIFEDQINADRIAISYYPLSGDKSDYNGMAEFYRIYLIENGLLSQSEYQAPAASFKILGGQQKKEFTFGIPHTVLSTLTSVSQAEEIARYFSENIDGKIAFSLVGFGESGLDVGKVGGGFKIAPVFGNKKQIKALTEFCSSSDIDLFLNFDLIGFNKSGNGFSAADDGTKLPDQQTLYLYGFNNVTRNTTSDYYMLLTRAKLGKALDTALNTTKNYSFDGVVLDSLSNTLYSDYSVEGAGIGAGMAKEVTELLSSAKEHTTVVTSNANAYAVGISDYVAEAPLSSSGYDVTSYDIPFYQMVFRGYIPMSGSSVNLASDSDREILKCIESGISPSFTLTYEYNSSVVTSKFSALSASNYDGIKEQIVEEVKKTDKIFSKLGTAKISDYQILSEDLRITTFDNGVKVAVNYSYLPVTVNSIEIAAHDYYIWEG